MKVNKLFYGTWELDGILKNISEAEAIELLKYAKLKGIYKFDTALVYGCGNVERMLSKIIDDNDIILTKIPAIIKPDLYAENIEDYYPENYISDKLYESLENLKRDKLDIVLLHNWSLNWKNNLTPLIELKKMKVNGIVKKIGISLPNNYNERLSDEVLKYIDYIEAPYNIYETWILNDVEYYRKNNIEIVLRSLFKQGLLLKEKLVDVNTTISDLKKMDVYLTIGMTSKKQIDQNIHIVSEGNNEK